MGRTAAVILVLFTACDEEDPFFDTEDSQWDGEYPVSFVLTADASYGVIDSDSRGITCSMTRTFWLELDDDGSWSGESDGWSVAGSGGRIESCQYSDTVSDREVVGDISEASLEYAEGTIGLDVGIDMELEVEEETYIFGYDADTSVGAVGVSLTLSGFQSTTSW